MSKNFMQDFSNSLARQERRQFIYFRDSFGRMCWRVRQWYDEKIFHIIAVFIIFLLASHWAYKDELQMEITKREAAEHRAAVAAGMYRTEGFIYMIEAKNLEEFEAKVRRIRNSMSSEMVHVQAAKELSKR